jgi:hypothetical protein
LIDSIHVPASDAVSAGPLKCATDLRMAYRRYRNIGSVLYRPTHISIQLSGILGDAWADTPLSRNRKESFQWKMKRFFCKSKPFCHQWDPLLGCTLLPSVLLGCMLLPCGWRNAIPWWRISARYQHVLMCIGMYPHHVDTKLPVSYVQYLVHQKLLTK